MADLRSRRKSTLNPAARTAEAHRHESLASLVALRARIIGLSERAKSRTCESAALLGAVADHPLRLTDERLGKERRGRDEAGRLAAGKRPGDDEEDEPEADAEADAPPRSLMLVGPSEGGTEGLLPPVSGDHSLTVDGLPLGELCFAGAGGPAGAAPTAAAPGDSAQARQRRGSIAYRRLSVAFRMADAEAEVASQIRLFGPPQGPTHGREGRDEPPRRASLFQHVSSKLKRSSSASSKASGAQAVALSRRVSRMSLGPLMAAAAAGPGPTTAAAQPSRPGASIRSAEDASTDHEVDPGAAVHLQAALAALQPDSSTTAVLALVDQPAAERLFEHAFWLFVHKYFRPGSAAAQRRLVADLLAWHARVVAAVPAGPELGRRRAADEAATVFPLLVSHAVALALAREFGASAQAVDAGLCGQMDADAAFLLTGVQMAPSTAAALRKRHFSGSPVAARELAAPRAGGDGEDGDGEDDGVGEGEDDGEEGGDGAQVPTAKQSRPADAAEGRPRAQRHAPRLDVSRLSPGMVRALGRSQPKVMASP